MKKNYCLFCGNHGDVAAIATTFVEFDHAVGEGEEGMIAADADVLTGVVCGAALADDDVAGDALLAAKDFDA